MKRLQKDSDSTGLPITSIIKWKPSVDGGDPENMLLAGDNAGNITKYDATDGMVVEQIPWDGEEENKIYALDYSSNGRQFAAAGLDKMVRIYDDITMKLVQESDPFKSGNGGHNNRIFSVKFSNEDPNILISGGWDNNIIIHDIREKGPVNAIIGANVCGDSLDIRGNRILSGSNRKDKQLQLWDLDTCKLIENIDWNGDGIFKDREACRVFCAKFMVHTDSGKEYIMAGGGVTNECRIFSSELEPIVNVGNFSRGCFSCDSSSTGDSFLCAGGDGVIRLFRIIFN
jgi:COMPASS component SWD3